MGCRVGMTTNLGRRKKEWLRKYPKMKKWESLAVYPTKKAAQSREKKEADKHECSAHGGGRGPQKARWHVYRFEY